LHEPNYECLCDEFVKRALVLIKFLNYHYNISFSMEVEVVGLSDGFQILDEFDFKFFIQKKT
jgi:hypothetical protein